MKFIPENRTYISRIIDFLNMKREEVKVYHECKNYQITMASVEPAGMIPNLNQSLGMGNS